MCRRQGSFKSHCEKRKEFFWLMLPKLHSKLQVHWAYWDCPKILLVQVGTLSSSDRSLG